MRLFPCQHRCYFTCANQVSSNFLSLVLQVSNESLRSLSTLEKLEDITMVCVLFTDDDGLQMLSASNSLKVITLHACKQSSFALFALLSTHDASECHLAVKFTLPVVVHHLLYTCRSTTRNSTSKATATATNAVTPQTTAAAAITVTAARERQKTTKKFCPRETDQGTVSCKLIIGELTPLFSLYLFFVLLSFWQTNL